MPGPLFKKVNPFVDCFSTGSFIKRLSGKAISSVVGDALGITASDATKLTWYGSSDALLERASNAVSEWVIAQNLEIADLRNNRMGVIASCLSAMPKLRDSQWTIRSQQYFNDLAALEADLQTAASVENIVRMQSAMVRSGAGQYLALVDSRWHQQWAQLNSLEDFRRESPHYARWFTLIGIALFDHELRLAVWPEHEPRTVFSPLLPQYRLTKSGSFKGRPVRPERRLLDVMYFAKTGKSASPTDEDLFPVSTDAMVKKVQRATLSAADCYAVSEEWVPSPEFRRGQGGFPQEDAGEAVVEQVVFEAYFFAAKALGFLFDNTNTENRKGPVPGLQRDYYATWKAILDGSPKFSGGSYLWDRSRLERLIRDEITFTK